MSLIELIGFVISLTAVAFLFFKRIYDDLYRKRNPEEAAERDEKKQKQLQEFLHTLDLNLEEEEEHVPLVERVAPKAVPPSPPPGQFQKKSPWKHGAIKSDRYQFESHLENYKTETAVEKRRFISKNEALKEPYHEEAYRTDKKIVFSRAALMIDSLPSRKQMVVLKELFDKPKSLRNLNRDIWEDAL